MQLRIPLVVALLVSTGMAGCFSSEDSEAPPAAINREVDEVRTEVAERVELPFNTSSDIHSWVLEAGQFEIITPGTQYMAQLELPPSEGVPAATGPINVSIGVHFPEIEGCDWGAGNLPARCHLPVIADIGPYYSASSGASPQLEGDAVVTEYTCNRLMCTLVDNFVPHGYAVAAVSVLGTGDSGHCQDLMGAAEQAGVQKAVEFLGTQAWSNGAVGLIGRSYDGSTPWEAAMVESDHLKTIVPISGLMGVYDLMWRNGSAESRGAGVLYGLYAAMTIDGETSDGGQAACPDYATGAGQGGSAYATGGTESDAAYDYWQERQFFDDVMANYDGSIYYIHGMQDWNVDNHQAFPYYNHFVDAGFEIKGLFGQWDHAYPDRWSERARLPSGEGAEAGNDTVRFDWAQDLLEWFNYYLKGAGDKPELHAEIQDNWGAWRVEDTYPPRDAEKVRIGFSTAEVTASSGTGEPTVSPSDTVILEFGALSAQEETRIAGNIYMPLTVTPTGPGGQVGATIYDAETDLRLGHAIMDLRYYQGGYQRQDVTPGEPIVAQMQFLAMDVIVPAGHGLRLELTNTVRDYLPATVSDPVIVDIGASAIRLPVVEPDESTFFQPPQRPPE